MSKSVDKTIKIKVESKVAVFKQAEPYQYSMYTSLSQQGKVLEAAQSLLAETFVEGDKEVYEDLDCLLSVLKHVEQVINPYDPVVEKQEDGTYKLELEGYTGKFRKPNMQELSKYLNTAASDGFEATRKVVESCMVEGDKELLSDRLVIATCDVANDLITVKRSDVEKS